MFYATQTVAPKGEFQSYTVTIPRPPGMGVLTDTYVWDLVQAKLVKPGFVEFVDYLYDSQKEPHGLQFKTFAKDATMNIYLPGGSLHVSGKTGSTAKDLLMRRVIPWTVPKTK